MAEMDIREVMECLPQRYPILMIDRVLECEPGKRIRALKNVTINEPQFTGHFPGWPIMPGVLILEAMAQASGILVFRTRGDRPDSNTLYFLAGIDEARFKRPVVPGDRLEIEAAIIAQKKTLWKFACVARVDGAVAAEAVILCTERQRDRA
jgi:3-hydroxyacyl-[acyl-carrier-protein] dehydratase